MTGEGMPVPNTELCGKLVSDDNLAKAAQKVKSNRGAPGIDGIRAEQALEYLGADKGRMVAEILARKYKPSPVRRVEIPKDNGKKRLLGIPTVRDRIVQQAVVQVLTPVFEPTFSDYSYGYRPGRSAEDAVRQAQIFMSEGYGHVVDLDLSKFFDTVDHDILMGLVDRHMGDKDIRRLIFVFLKAGVMQQGNWEETELGVPQGGPLSPLLANIYLTPFDREMEGRRLRFIRYADDVQLYTKSDYAARRVMGNAAKYLEGRLKLTVNTEKTEARKAIGSSLLGFTFTTLRSEARGIGVCEPKETKIRKLEDRVRELTRRSRGVSAEQVVREVGAAVRGWIAYYARGHFKGWLVKDFAPWLRRRVRQYLWKAWKTAKSRKHHLRNANVPEWQIARMTGWSSRSYWRMSRVMGRLMTNERMERHFGLLDPVAVYSELHGKRMKRDAELDFQACLLRQHAIEEEGRLLMEAHLCGNW
ncbi:MAG: group II intron reverse transcriptase/maturase [Sphaerochaetaceae bacterium]